ncbi:uncharacterized protein LOC116263947 [Nymphaea colorata]|uniref:uncharacterized protein LOC116263947 n=1 Tax=Nymphaea colorata TaxID=210225 RepID=UPI00129EC40E|nr:uncharacterized protein LOC116263947 [Nymphaea colorata]
MKKSATLFTSMAAASATLLSASALPSDSRSLNSQEGYPNSRNSSTSEVPSQSGQLEDRFAPRLDGLRFIETLVTAHR